MRRRTVVMRFDAPAEINRKLHVLASELEVNVRDLLLDGIALVLRYNDSGHGIAEPPIRPRPSHEDEDQEVEITRPSQQGAKS